MASFLLQKATPYLLPTYLRNTGDILHVTAAPIWIYLTALLGYLSILHVLLTL